MLPSNIGWIGLQKDKKADSMSLFENDLEGGRELNGSSLTVKWCMILLYILDGRKGSNLGLPTSDQVKVWMDLNCAWHLKF